MARPDFPLGIDASMRAAFLKCPRSFELGYLRHLRPLQPSVHLVAGGAYAKGLEVARRAYYEQGVPEKRAIGLGAIALVKAYGDFEPPMRHAKTCENVLSAFDYYFSVWPMSSDTLTPFRGQDVKRAIEWSFALPLPVAHPQSGDPILYIGRFDMLGEFGGGLWVVDDKTTGSLGASWSKQWDMRGQFTGYCWAARQTGLNVTGALVRGVSILKTKHDHAQAIVYKEDHKVEQWYTQILRDVQRMVQLWEEGYWDYDLSDGCCSFGECSYKLLCESPRPEDWLEGNYEVRAWDPLAHEEMPGRPATPEDLR